MSSSSILEPKNMLTLKNRMKARLALANFKLENGYSNIDLRTLESCLYRNKIYKQQYKPKKNKSSSSSSSNINSSSSSSRSSSSSSSSHQIYPRHYDMDRLIKKNASNRSSTIPLSNTRLSKRLSFSSDVEAAAHLLVLLHHSHSLH